MYTLCIMSKVYDPEVLEMMNDEFLRYRDDIYACDYTRRKVNLKHVPQFFLDHHRDYFNILNNQPFVYKKYLAYKNIPPFVPFLTLDISPNWTGHKICGRPSKDKSTYLKLLIENFASMSQRFDRCDYNIECGYSGDHLHLHAVLRINPKMEKTVITQQQKGNLTRSLRKVWLDILKENDYDLDGNKCEELRGVLEGKFAVKFSLWRKPEFLKDKTDYLCEELKPLDHKNSVNLNLRETIVFTSKV